MEMNKFGFSIDLCKSFKVCKVYDDEDFTVIIKAL